MTKVLFKRKTSDEIANLPVEDGAIIYNHETGATYLDYGNERIPTGGGMPTGDTFPIGAITSYAGDTAPVNWLICDGSAISRITYADLFDAIGTTYGVGDGSTTFNLPNLKGRVITGLDLSQTEFDTLGETGGEKAHTLTVNEMPVHNHGNIKSTIGGQGEVIGNTDLVPGVSYYGLQYQITNTATGQLKTDNAGGSQAHNILQPYITLNYIIKAFQSSGTVADVSTVETNSDTDTYSCNYINKIIESGSNANGNYIKYKDGTLICYKDHDFGNQTFNSAWGSLYETQKLNLGDFPVEFVGNYPGVQITARGAYFIERSYSASNTSWGQLWAVRAVNDTQGVSVSCLAIGKWK